MIVLSFSAIGRQAHHMSSAIAVPAPVVAVSAETFDQSIGVNIHLWETGSSYTNIALVEGALAYLGVTNVRDQLVTWSQTQSEYTALMALGYKFDFIEEPTLQDIPTFVSAIKNFEATYPGSILAIEGPNEVNLQPVTYNGGSGLINAAEFQQALDSAVRADPALSNIPVYNLTMAYLDATQYGQLGNLSQAANYANSHAYTPDSQTPASGLSVILPYAQLDAPGLPTVITETGFDTNPADAYSGVDQTVQAKLTLDTLMDAFKDGVAQTYLYELFDDASGNWGLFNADGTPKLAATAVHNLTTILADPGSTSSFIPGSLSYSVPDLPANGNQLLLEKSNGTFDLVVWAEADIWNPTTQSEIVAPTETSTVEFGQAEALVQVFDPLQGTTPIATYSNVSSIQVSLSDHPLIIQISGGTATTAATLTAPPTVSSLVESPSSGDLDAGKTVTLTLNMSEAVTVTGGTPTLTLNDGATATYTGGSGTSALTFSYTVAAGQNTSDLTATAVNLNSATITDGAGQCCQPVAERLDPDRPADRHHDPDGVVAGGIALDAATLMPARLSR